MTTITMLAVLLLALFGYWFGYRPARKAELAAAGGRALHSRPVYHGLYVAAWVGIPSLLLVLVWLLAQGPVIDRLLLQTLPEQALAGLSDAQIRVLLSKIHTLAAGHALPGTPPEYVTQAADTLKRWRMIAGWAMLAGALAPGLMGLFWARLRIAPQFRARQRVERILDGLMLACAALAILTTLGIIVSLFFESLRFFAKVPLTEFLFGPRWEPQIAMRADQVAGQGAFGMIPVFTGTLLISAISLLFAVPIGLFSAIYLVEYASSRFRAVVKPVLEFLAGIPTVVYGFFAVVTIAPALKAWLHGLGISMAPNSALVAGLVMGIMLIPFISSLSDDALAAVPMALREGSIGLGATKAETIRKVLLPAALPGIMSGILLAASRAIGETMIVVMAAGIIAHLTLNPLEAVTTVTVQIVTLLIGDTAFDSPKTLAAFALGLVLFLVTLALNVLSMMITRRYREQYD
ncbi:MAG TPA: phosphate ABC transporter permease subunit PstC [Thermopetrobacter sp.]|nr:phosphate ABC transporter permease subunit PstC [Thermopetrobacter sp.]